MSQDGSQRSGGAADVIAGVVADLDVADLDPAVVDRVEAAFVDTVGVALAGTATDAARIAASVTARSAPSEPAASLFSGTGTASLQDAGFANGTAAHALDFDDVTDATLAHPSACLVPAIVAVAEATDASGASAVTAYVAGFETEAALARPIMPAHYERGWHGTSTFGTFGATAAAASLLDLDRAGVATALNVAASMPAGLKRNFGSMVKPMHAGTAVRSGLTAALLAAEGFDAADDAIGGPGGFLDLYGGEPSGGEAAVPAPATGETLLEVGIDEKRFPCCYYTHTAIESALELAGRLEGADAVEAVQVVASRAARDALTHPEPSTPFEGRFSMQHVVAHALVHGEVGPSAFAPAGLADEAVAAVRERVAFEVDPALAYESYEATVTVRTTDGEEHVAGRPHPPGSSRRPLGDEERREKYLACASEVVDDAAAEAVYDRLDDLADEPAAAAFLDHLGGR